MSDSKNIMKLKMLNEFEKEFNNIVEEYNKKVFSTNDCIKYIKILISVWDCCRLDLKNRGNKKNTIKILKNNDLDITFPSWFKNEEGEGCQIISYSKNIDLSFRTNNDGNMKIILRGLNYKNLGEKRVPVYVICNKFILNKEEIINSDVLISHDSPFVYQAQHNLEDTLNLYGEFETICDYYPLLKVYLEDISEDNLILKFQIIKNYINYEKILVKLNDFENEIYDAMLSL